MRLQNKVAIITGGSRGIGFATADKFLKEGATVILTASSQESADKAVAQLKEKYPHIHLVINDMYTQANNISSVYLVRDKLQNAYISEADLLLHNQVFDKYVYRSCYLGIPTEETDDWYFKTNDQGVICELGIGSKDCFRMLGISYWDRTDGEKLNEHVAATFHMPGGKDEDWCYVPLVSFKDAYQVHVRHCVVEDIEEIDTFEELCAIDPSYNAYRQKM